MDEIELRLRRRVMRKNVEIIEMQEKIDKVRTLLPKHERALRMIDILDGNMARLQNRLELVQAAHNRTLVELADALGLTGSKRRKFVEHRLDEVRSSE